MNMSTRRFKLLPAISISVAYYAAFYRMLIGVDRNVGRIIKSLEQQSFKSDTVILFASDHGMYYGERGLSDCWQLNEESMRIPLIICDPRTQGGSRAATEEMV